MVASTAGGKQLDCLRWPTIPLEASWVKCRHLRGGWSARLVCPAIPTRSIAWSRDSDEVVTERHTPFEKTPATPEVATSWNPTRIPGWEIATQATSSSTNSAHLKTRPGNANPIQQRVAAIATTIAVVTMPAAYSAMAACVRIAFSRFDRLEPRTMLDYAVAKALCHLDSL